MVAPAQQARLRRWSWAVVSRLFRLAPRGRSYGRLGGRSGICRSGTVRGRSSARAGFGGGLNFVSRRMLLPRRYSA